MVRTYKNINQFRNDPINLKMVIVSSLKVLCSELQTCCFFLNKSFNYFGGTNQHKQYINILFLIEATMWLSQSIKFVIRLIIVNAILKYLTMRLTVRTQIQ